MISYEGLKRILRERKLALTSMAKALGISSRTIAKIGRGEVLSRIVLTKMAEYLGVPITSLCRTESNNPVLQTLRDEKAAHISGGLYHEWQVRMTYNSNHIEGSRLSEDQTRMIFETNTLNCQGVVPVDDILETTHHFRAIDYVIDVAEEPLTEEIVKTIHAVLKRDTKDATLSWFAVGDYKRRPNFVGGKETAKPQDVPQKMAALLSAYGEKKEVTLEDIVAFHADFETIHPFQDGNGRVGRLIALKECLRFGIVPFIIEDDKKAFYYRGLSEWERERGYLLDTCRDGQDTVLRLLSSFGIR